MNAWYEVWADEGSGIPYLLLLRLADVGFEVLDPAQGNRRTYQSSTYEDARNWLLEDEYVLVGRKYLDEGDPT
jgi:hypothetical protein